MHPVYSWPMGTSRGCSLRKKTESNIDGLFIISGTSKSPEMQEQDYFYNFFFLICQANDGTKQCSRHHWEIGPGLRTLPCLTIMRISELTFMEKGRQRFPQSVLQCPETQQFERMSTYLIGSNVISSP